jgi:hypothetical protein
MGRDKAVISGDIVAFTSLYENDRYLIERNFEEILSELEKKFGGYRRVIKGDYLEYYLPNPNDALRVALAIKCFFKSIKLLNTYPKFNRAKAFKKYGIRLAVGIGEISRFDPKSGIIDGDAIYFSGRLINKASNKYNTRKYSLKETLLIKTSNPKTTLILEIILSLLDYILNDNTARQSEVIYLKLMGLNEEAIASKMKVLQPTVNQHSTRAGWNAIEKSVQYFEQSINFDME